MNVFLVTSPFQYICANEARVVYGTTNNILVLIEQDSPRGIAQMEALLVQSNWDHVLRFPRNKRTTITPEIIKKVQQVSKGNLETLFYSEYHAWRSKLIIRNLNFDQHVFFDDGTMTFFDYYDHIAPKSTYYRPRWLQDLQLKLQGIKPIGRLEYFKNTEIFSIFSFPDCVTSYKENTLSTLKNNNNKNGENLTYYDVFIGQGSIDEKNRISLDDYIGQIESAISSSNNQLLYIPHRTEAKHVTDAVKKISRLVYHSPEYPIEIELSEKNIEPKRIIGLSSTALYTLSKIYPHTKISLIEQECMSNAERDKRIYNYLLDYFKARISSN